MTRTGSLFIEGESKFQGRWRTKAIFPIGEPVIKITQRTCARMFSRLRLGFPIDTRETAWGFFQVFCQWVRDSSSSFTGLLAKFIGVLFDEFGCGWTRGSPQPAAECAPEWSRHRRTQSRRSTRIGCWTRMSEETKYTFSLDDLGATVTFELGYNVNLQHLKFK